MFCAWRSAQLGIEATLFDRKGIGSEASWAAGGILSPLYPTRYPPDLNTLTLASRNIYASMIPGVVTESGIEVEFRQSGLIILDPDVTGDESPSRLNEMFGSNHSLLDGDGLVRLEPNLKPHTAALYLPGVAQVHNPSLLKALHISLERRGLVLEEQNEVTGFRTIRGRLSAVCTTGGEVASEKCVVAAGAWSGTLLASVGMQLPIRPIRGQMLLIRGPRGHLRHILVRDYRYLVPRADGHILVGSTLEYVGFDRSTTQDAGRGLREIAVDLMPSVTEFPVVAQWSGLRPGSPDNLPYIGEHPEISGLFVCAGHHRNGFATGPATAELVVDLVLGRRPALDPTPYRLDRPATPWAD